MNRLIFSQGGQPIYLEDISSLQQHIEDFYLAVLNLLNRDTYIAPFLSRPIIHYRQENNVYVGNGRIFYQNFYCDFEGGNFELGDNESVWVCIDKRLIDNRLFKDGQTRACTEQFLAHVDVIDSGNFANFKLEELNVFSNS